MLNGPTSNVTINTVNIYVNRLGYDLDSSIDASKAYGSIPDYSGVACSIQPDTLDEIGADNFAARGNVRYSGLAIFSSLPTGYTPAYKDKYVATDGMGIAHTFFTLRGLDDSWRGATFVIPIVEKAI
jgi:hypothetical protein